MAPKTMPCACTASALAVFIRRVAHINLQPTFRLPNSMTPFSVAKRKISTLRRHQSQQMTDYETVPTPSYTHTSLEGPIPFDPSASNRRLNTSKTRRRPLLSSSTKGPDEMEHRSPNGAILSENLTPEAGKDGVEGYALSNPQRTAIDSGGSPVLELTPESIDALAAESLQDNKHTELYATKPVRDAKQNRLRPSMKGFALHYSSPPVALTPNAKGDQNIDLTITKSRVYESATADCRHYHVADRETWQIQKAALKEKFKEGWNPRKRLSPDALAGIRAIHAQFPEQYTTSVLAEKFEVSPEAIRRILKSRWTPKEEEALDRQRRWFLRGQRVWGRYAELGLKPPARWRELGIGKRDYLAADRRERPRAATNITTQSANHSVQESEESFSAASASMAERIL